jgi:hypothetical protein
MTIASLTVMREGTRNDEFLRFRPSFREELTDRVRENVEGRTGT